MHELGVMAEAVKTIERIMDEQRLTHVETVVMEVGELSGIVPEFLDKVYPAVTYKTRLEGSHLRMAIVPGNGRCRRCGETFNIPDNDGVCPYCGINDFELLSGDGFCIREIEAC